MNQLTVLFAAIFGMLAILLGAFGAHALKKKLTSDQLQSFETGVKYQLYHAILLVILGFELEFTSSIEIYMAWCFIIGVFLFSFSIYALVLANYKKKTLRFLGPVTPIGGLSLLVGWGLLLLVAIRVL